jgi:hypothetical protein
MRERRKVNPEDTKDTKVTKEVETRFARDEFPSSLRAFVVQAFA